MKLKVVELLRDGLLFPQYEGLIRIQYNEDGYAILNYTDDCQYGRKWDEVTMACRGLIVDTRDWSVAALAFPKFFNYGEHETTKLANLPNLPFRIFEKIDGSLGIHYRDREGEPRLATRGSFDSEQAYYGNVMLSKLGNLLEIPNELTFLFEIVYKENQIVVKYEYDALVLLAIMNRMTGEELPWEQVADWAEYIGCRLPKTYEFGTPEEAMASAKALPANMEGYVLRFENGLRVKMKGDEYVTIHHLRTGPNKKTALDLLGKKEWENFIAGVPEEIRDKVEASVAPFILQASDLRRVAEGKFAEAPKGGSRKDFAMWVTANAPKETWPALFQMLDKADVNYYKLIKKL